MHPVKNVKGCTAEQLNNKISTILIIDTELNY